MKEPHWGAPPTGDHLLLQEQSQDPEGDTLEFSESKERTAIPRTEGSWSLEWGEKCSLRVRKKRSLKKDKWCSLMLS